MALREIRTLPDPVLRKKARKVAKVSSETRRLIEDMIATMRDAPGVGLAAPQVGVSQRVIVVEYAEEKEVPQPEDAPAPKPRLYALVNPMIVRASHETVIGTEGCLSVPGFCGDVNRFTEVTVEGTNQQGATVRIRAKAWLARIFQHEIDHLDGVLYVDRADKVWEIKPENTQENV